MPLFFVIPTLIFHISQSNLYQGSMQVPDVHTEYRLQVEMSTTELFAVMKARDGRSLENFLSLKDGKAGK